EAMIEVDLAPLLPSVRCPALVIRARDMDWGADASSRRFAAALPDAQIVLVDTQAVSGATPDVRLAIGAFFGEDWSEPAPDPAPPTPRPTAPEPQLRTILFTDLVGHTQMMSRLGDARGRELLREHERLTRQALAAHGGSEVKTLGDGFIASFGSAQ